MTMTTQMIAFAVCLFALLGASVAQSGAEECTGLLPELVDKCPAFEFAKEKVRSVATEPLVVAQDGRNDLLENIQYAYFSDACCEVLAQLDDSRCFCEGGVLDALQSNMNDELLELALTSSARPTPAGCGRALAASVKDKDCELMAANTEGFADASVLNPEKVRKHDGRQKATRDLSAKGSGCKNGNTIFKILADFDQAFGKIINFLNTNDDIAKLLKGEGPVTMFAPINFDIPGKQATEDTESIIKRHIMLGKFPAKKLDPGRSQLSINGERLTFTKDSGKRFVNGVQIMQKDIEACNGWVHVVETSLPSLQNSQVTAAPTAPSESNSAGAGTPTLSEILGKSKDSKSDASACDCSKDGVIDGVATGRPGCGQHLLNFDMNIMFCYLNDGEACAATSTADVSESSEFEGVRWRDCSLDEVQDLPMLQRLISKDVESLQLGWSLLKRSDALNKAGPYTVFVPSKLAIEKAVLNIDQSDVKSAERKMAALARNHIVAGNLTMGTLVARQESNEKTLVTLEGTPLVLSKDGDGRLAIGAGTHIEMSDMFASNGVAHVVDRVIVDGIDEDQPLKPDLQAPKQTPAPSLPVGSPPKRPPTRLPTTGTPTLPQTVPLAPPALPQPTVIGGQLPAPSTLNPPAAGGLPQPSLPGGNTLIRRAGVGGLPKRSNPCECSEDGVSGGVATGRRGCKQHIKGQPFFCYVKDPKNCAVAQESEGFPGAKIVPCSDPCACSATGKSGKAQTPFRGCDFHVDGKEKLCFVVDPENCKNARKSDSFPGSGWRFCPEEDGDKIPKPKPKKQNTDPCACSKDGMSGGVDTKSPGCGRYGAFGVGFICFVVDPSNCLLAAPSLRYSGASWRLC